MNIPVLKSCKAIVMVAILLVQTLNIQAQSTTQLTNIPVYQINLDLHPKERFKEVATVFKNEILAIVAKYEPMFPTIAVELFTWIDWTVRWIHYERTQEIDGIADTIGKDRHIILIINFVYEFVSYCTSIVSKSPTGEIIHERLLDFDFPDEMRPITYQA